ncbi:MAG TPA: hypothetical protein VF493_03030 [Terriglobales bacterium]
MRPLLSPATLLFTLRAAEKLAISLLDGRHLAFSINHADILSTSQDHPGTPG